MTNPVIIGDATLYLGDCLEISPTLRKVDAVITDPPYGTGWLRGGGKKRGEFHRRKESAAWDQFNPGWLSYAPSLVAAFCPIQRIWEMCLLVNRPLILKYHKTNAAPYGVTTEPVIAGGDFRGPDTFDAYNGDNSHHPCEKPTSVMRWLVKGFLHSTEIICDPFMGSGTTGVACMNLGRKFIGIEIEPKYFDIACERIDNAQRQKRMFA